MPAPHLRGHDTSTPMNGLYRPHGEEPRQARRLEPCRPPPSFPPPLAPQATAGKLGAPKRVSAKAGETRPSGDPQSLTQNDSQSFRGLTHATAYPPFVPAKAPRTTIAVGTGSPLGSRWSLCSGQPKAGPGYGNERSLRQRASVTHWNDSLHFRSGSQDEGGTCPFNRAAV